jgi:hypothetical protein
MVEDLMRALPGGLPEPEGSGVGSPPGAAAREPDSTPSTARSSEMDVAEAAIKLRDMATTALQSLRAAIKRHER